MAERRLPIYSTYEDEPELQDEISAFVIRLAERVDKLQDAEGAAEYGQLGPLASDLAAESERLGYVPLSDAAQDVSRACKEDKPEAAQEALLEVTELARRIRLGHRGAA